MASLRICSLDTTSYETNLTLTLYGEKLRIMSQADMLAHH